VTTAEVYERLAAARAALQAVSSSSPAGVAARALLARHLDAVTAKKAKPSLGKGQAVARQALAKVNAQLKTSGVSGVGEDRGTLRQAIDRLNVLTTAQTPEELEKYALQERENEAQLRQEVERHDQAALQKAADFLTMKAVRKKAAEVVETARKWSGGLLIVAAVLGGMWLLSKKGH
jgi:hypothetical protein